MSLSLWLCADWVGRWHQDGMLLRAARLTGVIVIGVAVYFGTLLAAGIRPRDFIRREAR
jgi:putative peptidoglycan lipid II flippase